MRYRSIRPDDDALREAMKAVAAQRRRFGYRRIHVMLERQSMIMKKAPDLYRPIIQKIQVLHNQFEVTIH